MSRSKIKRYFLFISLILILKLISYYHKEDKGFIGFFGRLLNKTNSFEVNYSNIDKKNIDIIWSSEEGISETLVKHGEIINNFDYVYGPEKFKILYKGKFLCESAFFSTNNNDPYKVKITISKKSENYLIAYIFDNQKTMLSLDKNRKKNE